MPSPSRATAPGAVPLKYYTPMVAAPWLCSQIHVLLMNIPSHRTRRFLRAARLLHLLAFAPLAPTLAASWESVPLGGGGYVTGLASNANGSAIYCRTDVGGAFRWAPAADGDNGEWISISDEMVPFGTANAAAAMGVEALGTDPNNASRVYAAAGNFIYYSPDQGATWTAISGSISMSPNGSYKTCGERLAVDPNNANIVWYGSLNSGLHKGDKTSGSWVWSVIPATTLPFGANAGISFVACDKNGGSTILYAGVFGTGVYRSTDGGATWSAVPGAAFASPRRAQLASNGTLYLSGGTTGAAKLPRGGSLALLSAVPAGPDYRGIAVDPNDAAGQTVHLASNSSASILRSTDGGATWANQSSVSQPRQEPDGTPSAVPGGWFAATSALLLNPANSNELWTGDFTGVARTRNANLLGGAGATWYTLQKGQEETVVAAVKNAPTGAPLFVGVGDMGGFRYANVTARPIGAGGDSFHNPNMTGNHTSLDFCESNPNVWASAWLEPSAPNTAGTAAFTSDGGLTWLRAGEIAAQVVANSSTAGLVSWDVGAYLAAQKAKGNNTVTLVVASSNIVSGTINWATMSFNSKEATSSKPNLLVNGSANLTPIADSYVLGQYPTTNYGADATLQVSYNGGIPFYSRWCYLKFDLSSVSSISSAILQLYRRSAGDTTGFKIGVYACPDTSWVEGNGGTDNVPAGELTWNNKPDTLANPGTNGPSTDWPTPVYTMGTAHLGGGRIALSATNPNFMVWEPVNTASPYWSNDRGVTWTASTGAFASQITGVYTNGNSVGMSGQPLASDRVNGKFYLAKFGGGAHVIYSSSDNGATWTQVASVSNGGSYNPRTPQLVTAPAAGDVWLCDDGTYNGTGGGLWRSTDSAVTWTKLSGVGKVTAVSFGKSSLASGYAVYIYGYVGTVLGVYQSENFGASWVKLADPTIELINTFAGDRQHAKSLFIGTGGRGTFRYNATETYEAEALSVQSFTSSDTEGVITDPAFSGDAAVELYSVAAGDQITFVVPGISAGTYDVRIGVKKWVSRGIWQMAIGPAGGSFTNVGSPQDNYASAANFTEIDMGAWTPGSTSDKWFRFTITGKNASSSGYNEVIDYIALTPL